MSLTGALTARTAAEVLSDTSDDIAARGGDDKSFPETSTARKLLDVDAAARAREEEIRAQITKAGSLGLITEIAPEDGRDGWIDFKAAGEFNRTRDPATFALHVFRLTNSPLGVSRTWAPGDLRARFGTLDFINATKADITTYAGSGTCAPGATLDLLFEALTAGSTGNIPAGYVTQLVTVFAGVSVSNPAIAGTGSSNYRPARDAERNESLLDRMISRWGATSAGGSTGSIVEWLHESFAAAGVTNTVTKWYIDDTNPDGPGTTRLYIANDSGPGTAAEIAIAQAYLNDRRTSGSGTDPLNSGNPGVLVAAATARAVAFAATLKNSSNVNAAADSLAVVTTLNAQVPLGAFTLYAAEMTQLLMEVSGTIDVTHDLANTSLLPGENLTLSIAIQVIP
jgi:uncharacterized phage protein gp47/JayE